MNRVSAALALRKLGWNTVAAPHKGKSPMGAWRRWQAEIIPEREIRSMFSQGEPNLFVITGSVSRLAVLDCDDEAAVVWWREQLGDALDKTTAARSGREDAEGYHFYFRLKPGQVERSRASEGGPSGKWSLQAEGKGVVAPPSVHESGREYAWVDGRGPGALQNAPAELFTAGVAVSKEDDAPPRSLLSHLLKNPPPEGGRNNWLAKVAGHYAKHIPHQDAYETLVREASDKLDPPLPESEVAKLLPSIWEAEKAKRGHAAEPVEGDEAWREPLLQPREETGWLVSGGTRILIQTKKKDNDGHAELGLATWMDADIRVLGVIDTDDQRVYEAVIRKPAGDTHEATLPARTVADPRALGVWLANRGVSIGPPDNLWPTKMPHTVRLTRYLEAQGAPALVAVPALGWHDESQSFITHEGIVRAEGPGPFENVRPHPDLRNWAPYRYGYGDADEARGVLREVLQFHDETVAAVFGAWWAACLLKPQILDIVSQFPFMALEAASESGKTTGYFSLMLQLSGNRGGQSNPTRAALRDYLSAHRSGIVWVDDLDDLEAHGELLRNVTVGGSLIKKGEGNHEQVVAKMRASLVVSGEGLGLEHQKALMDRAVMLEVGSPTQRIGKHGAPQWDDILDLKDRHPDLTVFAGTLVQLALAEAWRTRELKQLRLGTGRFADKIAIVRLGARILDAMVGGGAEWVVKRADGWATGVKDPGAENVLTLNLLPKALSRTGWKRRPEGPNQQLKQVATPAFVDEDEQVWFSPDLLADWWEREPPFKRVSQRVETAQALSQQARALGLGGRKGEDRKVFRYVTMDGRHTYWRCSRELSALLLKRSRGEDPDDHGEDENGQGRFS